MFSECCMWRRVHRGQGKNRSGLSTGRGTAGKDLYELERHIEAIIEKTEISGEHQDANQDLESVPPSLPDPCPIPEESEGKLLFSKGRFIRLSYVLVFKM